MERFDRAPIHADNPQGLGRIGMVSLMVYDAEYVGAMDNWAATANRMQERELLRPTDARTLRLSYVTASSAQIDTAIAALAEAIRAQAQG